MNDVAPRIGGRRQEFPIIIEVVRVGPTPDDAISKGSREMLDRFVGVEYHLSLPESLGPQ
jgi:hypothetical protein